MFDDNQTVPNSKKPENNKSYKFGPITDWSDDKISETQWVSQARSIDLFKMSQQAINATRHPWKDVFFDGTCLSANFKYFLGFIATDGHISTDSIALILSARDIQILEDLACWCSMKPRNVARFFQAMNGETYEMARLNFGGRTVINMVRDLLRVEGTNKTLALHPRSFLLTDPHFLRGAFDGDGSVCPSGIKGKASHMLQITSAAKDGFLDPLLKNLDTDLNIKCDRLATSGHSEITYVAEFWAEGAYALANHCYGPTFEDVNLLVLNRKRQNAEKINYSISLRARPVMMIWDGEKQLFPDYLSAAEELVYIHYGSMLSSVHKKLARTIAQEISANFTKPTRRGQKIYGATFEIPTIQAIANELDMTVHDLCLYNPHLVPDLDKRSAVRPEVNYDLSPVVIRYPDNCIETLYLNCADAARHPALQRADCGRGAVQNLKRRFKGIAPGHWICWTIRKTNETLELRLPTISETLAEINKRSLHCNEERVKSKLLAHGLKP